MLSEIIKPWFNKLIFILFLASYAPKDNIIQANALLLNTCQIFAIKFDHQKEEKFYHGISFYLTLGQNRARITGILRKSTKL